MPSTETDGDSLVFIFDKARAKNPEGINSLMNESLETIPILYGFTIENLSDDQVSIQLEADAPMKVYSGSRSAGGVSFRVQVQDAVSESNG